MKVTHSFSTSTQCPNGGETYYYLTMELDLPAGRIIQVEDIAAALNEIVSEPVYQEDLTAKLATRFQCKVTSEGTHLNERFKTRCEIDVLDLG